jgi:hypothetical protein
MGRTVISTRAHPRISAAHDSACRLAEVAGLLAPINSLCQRDGVTDAGFPGGGRDIDQDPVADRVGAAVVVDEITEAR